MKNIVITLAFLTLSSKAFCLDPTWQDSRQLLNMPMHEGADITVYDHKNGNTGTLTNGPFWVTGLNGAAVSFDGTNDVVNVANQANFNFSFISTFSVIFAFKGTAGAAATDVFIAKAADTGSIGWCFKRDAAVADNLAFSARLIGGAQLNGGGTNAILAIKNGKWHTAGFTYGGQKGMELDSRGDIYFDGVRQTITQDVGGSGPLVTDFANSTILTIGNSQGANEGYKGAISNVIIFNVASGRRATDGEFLALHNIIMGRVASVSDEDDN